MCWIFREEGKTHGPVDLRTGLANSCNDYFFDIGYRLSLTENGEYDEKLGLARLQKYAEAMQRSRPRDKILTRRIRRSRKADMHDLTIQAFVQNALSFPHCQQTFQHIFLVFIIPKKARNVTLFFDNLG